MLTYEDLAKAPVRFDLEETEYDHAKQFGVSPNFPTINGTRTFDYNGRPSDNDQD